MKFLVPKTVSAKITLAAVVCSVVLLGMGGILLNRFQAALVADYNQVFRATISNVIEARATQEFATLHKNIHLHSNILTQNVALPLYNINPAEARNTLLPFMAYPDVVAVQIRDDVNDPFAAAWRDTEIETDTQLPANLELPTHTVELAVMYREQLMGKIEVFYSDDSLRDAVSQTKQQALITVEQFHEFNRHRLQTATLTQTLSIAAIILILLLVLGGILFRWVRQPLRTVNAYLKELAKGHLDAYQINYSGDDEISALYTSAQRLKSAMQATIEQANAVASGDYEHRVMLLSKHDQLGKALADMTAKLKAMSLASAAEDWQKNALSTINEAMRGAQDVPTLSHNVLTALINQVDADVGLLYFHPSDVHDRLTLVASYALRNAPRHVLFGEGLVGYVAQTGEIQLVTELPDNYLQLETSAHVIHINSAIIVPLLYEGEVKGIVELGKIGSFSAPEQRFLRGVAAAIGIELYAAESRMLLADDN